MHAQTEVKCFSKTLLLKSGLCEQHAVKPLCESSTHTHTHTNDYTCAVNSLRVLTICN